MCYFDEVTLLGNPSGNLSSNSAASELSFSFNPSIAWRFFAITSGSDIYNRIHESDVKLKCKMDIYIYCCVLTLLSTVFFDLALVTFFPSTSFTLLTKRCIKMIKLLWDIVDVHLLVLAIMKGKNGGKFPTRTSKLVSRLCHGRRGDLSNI